MAKVNQTKQEVLGPQVPPGRVEIIQGNIPVLTIQLLAKINENIVELGKKLDAVIEEAKNG